jgi:iron(III) transport system permease protein
MTSNRLFPLASKLIGIGLALLILYPASRVVAGLFWTDGSIDFSAVTDTLAMSDLTKILLDTTLIVVTSATGALLIGASLAWLNERTDARMGVLTDVIPILNFLLPVVAGAIGWLLLLSPRAGYLNWMIREVLGVFGVELTQGPFDANSWPVVIFVYTLNLVPFAFLLISAGLRNMDPSLEEQSAVCGAGLLTTLRRVTLPLMKPSVVGSMFLMSWFGLALFSVPLILAQPAGIDVLSVRIVEALRNQYPAQTGIAIGLGAFVMFALGTIWYIQRRILTGGRFGAIGGKSGGASRMELGSWRWVARSYMIGYLIVAVLLPFGALLVVTLNGYWTLNVDWGSLDLDSIRRIFEDRTAGEAFRNSLILASVAATTAVVLAAVASTWIAKARGFLPRLSEGAMRFPAAVSNTVLALGFVLAFGGPPFRLGGTVIILLMAYIVVSMPEAAVVSDTSLSQIGEELSEASEVAGASSGRTFRRVLLPLMAPGLLAGWALIFVRVLGDLQVSALLAAASNPVVGFQILYLFTGAGFGDMAALATLLTLMSTTIVASVLLLSRRTSRWTRPRTARTGSGRA